MPTRQGVEPHASDFNVTVSVMQHDTNREFYMVLKSNLHIKHMFFVHYQNPATAEDLEFQYASSGGQESFPSDRSLPIH